MRGMAYPGDGRGVLARAIASSAAFMVSLSVEWINAGSCSRRHTPRHSPVVWWLRRRFATAPARRDWRDAVTLESRGIKGPTGDRTEAGRGRPRRSAKSWGCHSGWNSGLTLATWAVIIVVKAQRPAADFFQYRRRPQRNKVVPLGDSRFTDAGGSRNSGCATEVSNGVLCFHARMLSILNR